jgi:hypothetical protein
MIKTITAPPPLAAGKEDSEAISQSDKQRTINLATSGQNNCRRSAKMIDAKHGSSNCDHE